MRLPLGSTSVSASGGTVELVGRRGLAWTTLAARGGPLDDAIGLLEHPLHDGAHADDALLSAVPSADETAPRFAPGQIVLWRYGRTVEAARVVRDDPRGLVTWIPTGSARLDPVPVAGEHVRDVPLEERFRSPWRIRESAWTGPGLLRAAPTGRPWSVWFFRTPDGAPAGTYINLELPHRRLGGDVAQVFTRDLVLDLWVDAEHPGAEDIWLKDADELAASVAQGRFTSAQADAVRQIADLAAEELLAEGSWPLGEDWMRWTADQAMDEPVTLPESATIAAHRRRSGDTSLAL